MKKTFLLSLIPVLALANGCSKSEPSPATAADEPVAIQARTRATPQVNVAELNKQLAIKMTFASTEDILRLLDQGATAEAKNRHGLPVIFMAAQRGDAAIIERLLKAGADANSKIGTTYNDDGVGYTGTTDGTPLSYAAGAGKIAAMKALHHAGADVNGQGPEGTTPLMQAAQNNQLAAVQWLLQNGATAGRQEALSLAQRFINPDAQRKQIIALLQQAR